MKLTGAGKLLLATAAATVALSLISETAGLFAAAALALLILGLLGGFHGGPRRAFADEPAARDAGARSLDRDFFVNR